MRTSGQFKCGNLKTISAVEQKTHKTINKLAHTDFILNVSFHRISCQKHILQNMIKDEDLHDISFEVFVIALLLKLLLDIGIFC